MKNCKFSNYHLEPAKTEYSLKGRSETFNSIDQLIDFILNSGICPSIKVLRNGEPTGETAAEFLVA